MAGPPWTAQIPRVNGKLNPHWISPELPHLSSSVSKPSETRGVRHANVPWMTHIFGLGADEHIELSMWLGAFTAQAQRRNYQGRALPLS